MPDFKLYSFQARGFAEKIRYIFAYAGVKFEDVHMEHEQFDAKFKSTHPAGHGPLLEIDGKHMLGQTTAIARYLANEFHLTGADKWETAQADMYVFGLMDLHPHFRPVFRARHSGDENAVKEEWAKFKTEHLKQFMDRYEHLLAKSGNNHLVGSKTTWADLVIAEFLDRMQSNFDSHLLEANPKLSEFVKKVHELPGVKEYIGMRVHH